MPIITLTTDFGTADPYVGIMKGVILTIARPSEVPGLALVDLTHRVRQQDIMAGALTLEAVLGVFPPGAIHIGVVDPGVGGSRAAVAVETDQGTFIGPDNGLFTAVLRRAKLLRAVSLTDPRYHRQPVSATFHGRDIFAPAAAHLARGADLADMGTPIAGLINLPMPEPVEKRDELEVHILTADRFGNLITDLTRARYEAWLGRAASAAPAALELEVGHHTLKQISRTYSEVDDGHPVAYFGSTDRLEIAIRNGSAEQMLNAPRGSSVMLRRA
jgi:S-adenosylmethionine hydrolase